MPPEFASSVTGRRPKISIMLITYNHEKFIGQALDSILMQETEYDYEINVIEDCSTDRTQEIVMEYVRKHPNKVKPYFNKKNIGFKVTQKNFFRGFKTLKGDYIAILEGDDYWSSPHKLQKQISFLESHPDYVGCAHNTVKIYDDGSKEPHRFLYWENMREDNTVENFINLNAFFHTTTLVYRNVLKDNPPPQFENPWSCDIFITIAHAQFGKIRYFNEDMAVYRAHAGGRFSNLNLLDAWMFNIEGLRRYNAWLHYRYLKAFSDSIVRYCTMVLNDRGKTARKPGFLLFLKLLIIRNIYKLLQVMSAVPVEVRSHFVVPDAGLRGSKQKVSFYGFATAYAVFCFFKACATYLIQIAIDLVTLGTALLSFLLPESQRKKITDRWEAFCSEDVKALQWLWHEGRLFTLKGAYHTRGVLRQMGRKLVQKLSGIAKRYSPSFVPPLRHIYHRLRAILRLPVALLRRIMLLSQHEEIQHLRWLWKKGRLFTPQGAKRFRAILVHCGQTIWWKCVPGKVRDFIRHHVHKKDTVRTSLPIDNLGNNEINLAPAPEEANIAKVRKAS